MLEPLATCLTYKIENQIVIIKSLTPRGGYWPKELRWSSQYGEHKKTHLGAKQNPRDYGTKEDVTVTGSLWRGGGCRQDGLGTTVVLEPKSQ